MERYERIYLQAVRQELRRSLQRIDDLLRTPSPPARLSRKEIRQRAARVCRAIKNRGGRVTDAELRAIVRKQGILYRAVGGLFTGKYIARAGRDAVVLTEKGRRMAVRRDRR